MAARVCLLLVSFGLRTAHGARRDAVGSPMKASCPEHVVRNTKGDCFDPLTKVNAPGCCDTIDNCGMDKFLAAINPYDLLMQNFASQCGVNPSHLSMDTSTGDVTVVDSGPICSETCDLDIALPEGEELEEFLEACHDSLGARLDHAKMLSLYARALVKAKAECSPDKQTSYTTTSRRSPPVRNDFPCIDNWKANPLCDDSRCSFYQPGNPVCHTPNFLTQRGYPYMACNQCCDKFAKGDAFRVKEWFCVADYGCVWAGTTGEIESVSTTNCDVVISFGKTHIQISHGNLKKLELL